MLILTRGEGTGGGGRLTVAFCSVSHTESFAEKRSDKLTTSQLLMRFIYSTIGALAFSDAAGLVCFDKRIYKLAEFAEKGGEKK